MIGNVLCIFQTDLPDFQDIVSPLQDASTTEIGKDIQHFVEGIPALLKVLDEIAQIHPFIGGQHVLGLESS